ncbi:hypothetical protein HMPREF0860_0916 [Treponema socranskii subsp. socranskii VPI DR56BR1116 = ATCC 35536]|uniref:Uncharacterized protein n=1 Tax=Treponema socranskii subsp. socranskii VPI DR56BR1116 = ATCC 35536 TaxID=1125725 RepID=U2MPK8_TRESO|nr:hypothetical protein HMPREF1325_1424 [Treponema socranskii subsp. socranskii VPI DR56BR1116 = ATCC 35536]ERK01219.1 hypothetical protein HMPREF0860_0916 [Treponema socranskii subsp. socranskii VPI DR56BR1116 = ATCC 35536]
MTIYRIILKSCFFDFTEDEFLRDKLTFSEIRVDTFFTKKKLIIIVKIYPFKRNP